MTIRIEIDGNSAAEILHSLREISAALLNTTAQVTVAGTPITVAEAMQTSAAKQASELETYTRSVDEAVVGLAEFDARETAAQARRELGKPSEGKARRTKEEIAEDDKATSLAEQLGVPVAQVEDGIRQHGHSHVIARLEELLAAKPNISTSPEDRVDPNNPDPETEAQDAADEQAEVEETDGPLTREDVKAAMLGYVQKYGMPAAQEDGPKIFQEALGKPPGGEAFWKLSLIAEDDHEALAKAIATWKKATELNPLKREAV